MSKAAKDFVNLEKVKKTKTDTKSVKKTSTDAPKKTKSKTETTESKVIKPRTKTANTNTTKTTAVKGKKPFNANGKVVKGKPAVKGKGSITAKRVSKEPKVIKTRLSDPLNLIVPIHDKMTPVENGMEVTLHQALQEIKRIDKAMARIKIDENEASDKLKSKVQAFTDLYTRKLSISSIVSKVNTVLQFDFKVGKENVQMTAFNAIMQIKELEKLKGYITNLTSKMTKEKQASKTLKESTQTIDKLIKDLDTSLKAIGDSFKVIIPR